jgi:flagellar FliJ protein
MNPQRLNTIRKLREQTRDERRRDVAQALEAERILLAQLRDVEAEIEATRDRTRRLGEVGALDVEQLIHSRRYESLLKSQLAALHAQLKQVNEELERRRQLLVEADREVKVLEKLEERARQQEEYRAARREARQLDEVAIRRFVRQEATS